MHQQVLSMNPLICEPPQLYRRLLLLGVASLPLLSACGTETVSPQPTKAVYTEEMSSLFVTQDAQKIVFIGKKFTYIFTNPELIKALQVSFRSQLRATLGVFVRSNHVGGHCDLELPIDGTKEQKTAAEAAGYTGSLSRSFYERKNWSEIKPSSSDYFFVRHFDLQGERFGATDMTGFVNQKLNRTYAVEVEELSAFPPLEPSPIRQGVDGAVFWGAAPLILVLLLLGGLGGVGGSSAH
jgi:hypothetical protein